MKAVDLFCCSGGFSLGAHAAGFDVACAYDFDPILTSSWATNFPGTKLSLRDISALTGDEVRSDAGSNVDLIFGGPPCQGFSAIGRRDKADERRRLLDHFFRLVKEVEPGAFVMENVKGLGFKDARGELIAALEQVRERYVVSDPMILDAADFGAATRRQRLFVVGYDPEKCGPIDFDALERRRDSPTTVLEAIGDLRAAVPHGELDDDLWKLPETEGLSEYAKSMRRADGTFTGNRRTVHTAKVLGRFAEVPQGGMEKIGRYPRLSWSGQCPTLRAGTASDKGSYQSVRPLHPEEDRVITVREAARLQGFPDSHRFHDTIWHSFRMIGNSVSPIIAREILGVVADAIERGRLDEAA